MSYPFSRPPVEEDVNLREFGHDLMPATLGQTLGAMFWDTRGNLTALGSTQLRLWARGDDETSPELEVEELRDRYGELGLEFDRPMREGEASLLAEIKREELLRTDIMRRGPDGFGARMLQFGAGLAGLTIDPVGLGLSFVPFVGAARFAGIASRIGTVPARISVGAGEAALGTALVEPLIYGLNQAQQRDFTFADALIDIGFSAAFGAVARPVLGAIGDVVGRGAAPAAPSRLMQEPEELRAQTLRAAVSQVVQGETPHVGPILREAQLKRDLMGGTAVRAPETFEPSAAARAEVRVLARRGAGDFAIAPDPEGIRSTVQALQRKGAGPEVTQLGDQQQAVTRSLEGEVYRTSTGRIRTFPSASLARKEIARRGLESAYPARLFPGEKSPFAIFQGSKKELADLEASAQLGVARPKGVPPRTEGPSLKEFGRSLEGDFSAQARAARRSVLGPELADQVAREAVAAYARQPRQTMSAKEAVALANGDPAPVNTSAAEAQEFLTRVEDEVAELRAQGLLPEDFAPDTEGVTKAALLGRAARAAAICLTRG